MVCQAKPCVERMSLLHGPRHSVLRRSESAYLNSRELRPFGTARTRSPKSRLPRTVTKRKRVRHKPDFGADYAQNVSCGQRLGGKELDSLHCGNRQYQWFAALETPRPDRWVYTGENSGAKMQITYHVNAFTRKRLVLSTMALALATFWFHRGLNRAFAAPARFLGPINSQPLALSADGSLLAVANPDNNSITVFDTTHNAKLAETLVGKEPNGVAFSA